MAKATYFKFKALDGNDYTLTFKEKLFCEKYLEFKGNGVDAIYEAGYKPKNARVAASMASEYLTKPNICAYITSKLEEYGFNDDNVTKQHLYLVNQFGDLKAKKGAIDMFYKLKGQYAATKLKFVDDNEDLTDQEIDDLIAEDEKQRKLRQEQGDKKKAKSA